MKKNSLPIVILSLLGGVFALVLVATFVITSTNADQADTLVDINNVSPTVDTVIISTSSFGAIATSINLVEATTNTIYVHGSFTDENGCTDVTDDGFLYNGFGLSTKASCKEASDADPLDCYYDANFGGFSNCSISDCSGPSDTTGLFQCIHDIYFFADATDASSSPDYEVANWIAEPTIFDGIGADKDTATTEMNTLLAVSLSDTTTINYGTLALNATSSPVTLEVRNTGNYASLNLGILGTHMPCDIGTLATSSQHFSSTSEDYADMTGILSATQQNLGGINL